MFGYVNANKKSLAEKDQKTYQSYYCGLCQKLKEIAGSKGQVLLNYDLTFLALLLSGLYEPREESRLFTCALHPKQKKLVVSSEIMDYCAYMDIVLSYYNLLDDYADDGRRAKKKLADSLRPVVEIAKEKYARQTEAIEKYIAEQNQAELARESNLSKVTSLTGEMLGCLCQMKEDDPFADDLYTLGFYLGRFIYVLDAYEDLSEDVKKKHYNPLILRRDECPECFETFIRQYLTTQMEECARAFEHMPILKNAEIIRNILYSGVWTKYDYHRLKEERRKTS
ncbi:DUF5685 family protein [Lachnospiraceae bacterium YH-ros2228]|jgi:hypothetical protein|nr:DUF5685 family protein [Lachnospiraceae bacterium]MDD6448491.1 DUF5685 family protein [Lachnospiraceae bacterium]MDD6577914.1 DUF5685 family protein [Lachnospiraceae bacterium]